MKSNNILHIFFTCVFLLGALSMNAQTKIYVHKSNGTAVEFDITDIDSISFNSPAPLSNYSNIKINEVSGVGQDPAKFYELINIGDDDISLEGCKIYYNNDPFVTTGDGELTWTGCEEQVIVAGELFSLIGRRTNCSFTTGLTAQRNIKITFRDPAGNLIDEFFRAQDSGVYAISDKSYSRIPDGTGPFYFTEPTPDIMNGLDAAGLLEVPATQISTAVDYTSLKINEVNGASGEKWFEIYNAGDTEINLNGVTAHYSNSEAANYSKTWVGLEEDIIPAKGYFSTKGIALSTGLSANNINVRLQLRDPDSTVLDTYEKLANINTGYDEIKDKSHARIPDGTGTWYYTKDSVGTPGLSNGTLTDGLTKIGEE